MAAVQLSVMYVGPELSWSAWMELAGACESAGVDGLFIGDHYVDTGEHPSRPGRFDAWTVLSGLAAVTTRLRLGTLMTPVTFRPPAVTAKIVATADEISGGRIELGLGAGWFEREHKVFGFPFPPLRERLQLLETHAIAITGYWAEVAPPPVQTPRPRLITGGLGKRRTVEIAARHFDEYNRARVDPEGVLMLRHALDAAGGKHVDISLTAKFLVTEEQPRIDAFRSAAMSAENRYSEADRTDLVGSADHVQSRLQEFADAGVARVYLRLADAEDLPTVAPIGAGLAGSPAASA